MHGLVLSLGLPAATHFPPLPLKQDAEESHQDWSVISAWLHCCRIDADHILRALHLAAPASGADAKPAPPSKGTTSPPAVSSIRPPHHDV